ncbi:MAG: sulfatase-like hydrolase/transferase [Phycisphaeraceae bacterium]
MTARCHPDPSATTGPSAKVRPPARHALRPNFLFVLADQHRHDWLGCAGMTALRTPHLDALAKRGTRLTRTYCAAPVCGPSRACLAAGVEYPRCGTPNHSTNFPLDRVTYYRLLRDAGYHVTGCGKFDLHKATHDWGVDGQHLLKEWGFSAGLDNAGKRDAVAHGAADEPRDPYMAYLHQRGLAHAHAADLATRRHYHHTHPTPLDDQTYCDNWIGRQALRLLDESPAGRPWHLVVNFAGPHEPMDVTADMHRWYRDPPVDFPPPHDGDPDYSADQHQQVRRNYAAMIENLDRHTGLLVDQVRRRGELEHTIIVYASDHGEMLGDHRQWGKVRPWEASVRVPLIIAGPAVRPGAVTEALTSLIDIGATFLDYAGLLSGVERPKHMDSRSLRPVLEGRAQTHRMHVRSGLGPWRMVRDDRFKLVTGFTPDMPGRRIMKETDPGQGVMLWDLREDPNEDHDIAPDRPDLVAPMTQLVHGR